MPTSVVVHFDASDGFPATPRRLHAAVSGIFDLPRGITRDRARDIPSLAHRPAHDNAGVKPYSIGQIGDMGRYVVVELRLVDDRLVETLDAWLAWGGVLEVGDGGEQTAALAAVEAQIIRTVSWEELAQTPPATCWDVEFLTPTVFSSRGRHVQRITPASLMISLQQRWWSQDPGTAPTRYPAMAVAEAFDWDDATVEVPVTLAKNGNDPRGRLGASRITAYEGRMRVWGREEGELAATFSRLMALAEFSNVGSYTSYGLGVMVARTVGEGDLH